MIGGGDYAKKIIRLLQRIGTYEIAGYVDVLDRGEIFGVPYLGNDDFIETVYQQSLDVCVALGISGGKGFSSLRRDMIDKIRAYKIHAPNIISENAYIDEYAEIGEGCIVFDGGYVDLEARVGDFSVINLHSVVCHGVKLSENVTVSPGCLLAGGAIIGNDVFLGVRVAVSPYVKIVDGCLIGSGSVVVKDCLESGTYYGYPARLAKK